MHCYNAAHCEEPLNLACVDPACGQQGLICGQCQTEAHVDHQKISTKHLLMILEKYLQEEESKVNSLTLTAEIDTICLQIRSSMLQLQMCKNATERERVSHAITGFMQTQRQQLDNYQVLLRQLLKAAGDRDGRIFNETFRAAASRFKFVSEEKAPLKRLQFVRSVLPTVQSVHESIQTCIRSNASLPTILGCLNVREKPMMRFRFSATHKGKTIKLLDQYTAEMEASGSERMIMMEPSLEGCSMPIKWRINILKKKSWIGVGICHLNTLKAANFNFEYTEMGHGNYLISSNGYSWSSLKPEYNSHFEPFTFDTGDVIELTFSPKTKRLQFQKVGKDEHYGLDFEFRTGDPLHPAVNLTGIGDSVEILT